MYDWIVNSVLTRLVVYDVGGYSTGDLDRKIRVLTDFMRAFVAVFGTLHKNPLTDVEFNKVLAQMAEMYKASNMPYTTVVVPQNPPKVQAAPSAQAPGVTKIVPGVLPPPTVLAPQPVTVSQLVTAYERDPMTGQIRKVQVYRPVPVQQPTYYQNPSGVVYAAPSPANNYHAPRGYTTQYTSSSHSGHYGVSGSQKGPYAQVYHVPAGSSSQAPQHGSNPYAVPQQPQQHQRSGSQGYPGLSSSTAPAQPQPRHPPQPHYAYPHAPMNYPSSSSALPPPGSDIPANLPIDQWDAVKPDRPSSASSSIYHTNAIPAPPHMISPPVSSASAPNLASSAPLNASYAAPISAPPAREDSPHQPLSAFATDSAQALQPPISTTPNGTPKEDEDDKNVCKICFERDLDCALLPCSHVTCYQCATTLKLTKCPFCRQDVAQVLKLYRA